MLTDENQKKTYLYLRAGMVLVIVMLFAAIAIEWSRTGESEDSISDYVHTPARAVFIAALVTIGACMVIIRGYIDVEDIALNLAGLLAPIVAFVPVSGLREGFVDNVYALLVAEMFGVAGSAVLVWRARANPALTPGEWKRQCAGVLVAAAVVLTTYLWLRVGDAASPKWAHYTAAILLFVFIGIVVYINAIYFETTDGWPWSRSWLQAFRNRYGLIALGMIVVPILLAVGWFVFDWHNGLLWIEAALIVLFATFWVVQTVAVARGVPPPTARAVGAESTL